MFTSAEPFEIKMQARARLLDKNGQPFGPLVFVDKWIVNFEKAHGRLTLSSSYPLSFRLPKKKTMTGILVYNYLGKSIWKSEFDHPVTMDIGDIATITLKMHIANAF